MNIKYKTRMKVIAVLLTGCFIFLMVGVLSKTGILVMSKKDYETSRANYILVKTDKESYEKVLGDIFDRNGIPILSNDTPVAESAMDFHKSYSHILGNVHIVDEGFINSNYKLLTNTHAKDVNPDKGFSVSLTLDDELQRHTYSLTEGKRGSIVVLKRHSGELLACTSTYKQDFNLSGIPDKETLKKYDNSSEPVWTAEYLNPYSDGSCQKAFTAAVAYETGMDDYILDDIGYVILSGEKLPNFNEYSYGLLDMNDAFIYSANTYFAMLFNHINIGDIRNYSSKALLSRSISTDVGTIDNRFHLSARPIDKGHLGIGQNSELSTLGMALMLQSVIDNEIYRPHVQKSTCINAENGALETVETKDEDLLASDIFSNETCENVRGLMEAAARSEEYLLSENILGAKSGTAEITVFNNKTKKSENTDRASLMAYNEDFIVVVSIIEKDRFGIHNKEILESVFNTLDMLYPPEN